MKIRTLLTAFLGILFISGLSVSQEPASPQPAAEESLFVAAPSPEPRRVERSFRDVNYTDVRARRRSLSDETVMRIFVLEYYPVEELEHIIENIFDIDGHRIHADRNRNRLILQATKTQMNNVISLIAELDVPASDIKGSHAVDNLVYRVFMFEIPSKDQDMKSFSMIFQMPSQIPTTTLLEFAVTQQIQVIDLLIIDEDDGRMDVLIRGKAPSNGSVKDLAKSITPSQIKELKWADDETFTREIEAAHYSRLPAQITKHIQTFLGENIVTVGYWFGSSSIPGEVEAPLGPWKLQLELRQESNRKLELRVDVETLEERKDFDRQLGRERSDEILSNTIQAKIGKPIIIGYNRDSYGRRKMGAMVIIPETMQFNTSESAVQ